MTLLDFGYAPGNYSSTCLTCGRQIQGVDKRCFCCFQCAKEKIGMATTTAGPESKPDQETKGER